MRRLRRLQWMTNAGWRSAAVSVRRAVPAKHLAPSITNKPDNREQVEDIQSYAGTVSNTL